MRNKDVIRLVSLSAVAASIMVVTGCQTTGNQSTSQLVPYSGEMTRTQENNLLRFTDTIDMRIDWDDSISLPLDGRIWEDMSKDFKLSEPMSFKFPLIQMLDCGDNNNSLNAQRGTLTITRAESPENGWDTTVYGYVSSDEFDVSKCTATAEFMVTDTNRKKGTIKTLIEGPYKKPAYGTGFAQSVYPKLKTMKKDVIVDRYAAILQRNEQEKLSNWQVRELTDTAQGIGMMEVCMEKGTYFLPNDRKAKKFLKESEDYAKKGIHSKVDGKHYWDKSIYQQQRQVGLIAARGMWEHSYFDFANTCAAFRNAVDAHMNK